MKKKPERLMMIKKILAAGFILFFICQPVLAEGNLEKADRYFSEGNFKKSAKYAEKALKEDPGNIKACVFLAESFSERGQMTKAIEVYKDMIKQFPDNMDLVFRLGLVYNKFEYHQNAVDTYKKILEKEPGNVLAHHRLGVSYSRCMELSAAYAEYRILKNLDDKLARDLLQYIQTNK
ncbi:MAG: tetratricopeptide repeat protein [Proteobacteria bacterium]|nr:tetratricopeptide repeat protein [Pseudomonadota bacterium]